MSAKVKAKLKRKPTDTDSDKGFVSPGGLSVSPPSPDSIDGPPARVIQVNSPTDPNSVRDEDFYFPNDSSGSPAGHDMSDFGQFLFDTVNQINRAYAAGLGINLKGSRHD